MTDSMARKEIVWSDGISIDKQGVCWKGKVRAPTTSVMSQYGVKQIAFSFDGEDKKPIPIWRLLSYLWYDQKIVLPRDGNALDYSTKNTIVVSKLTHSKETPAITDPEEILLIWTKYCQGVTCDAMSAETRLFGYSIDSFRSLIGDILLAGIR